MGSAKTVENSDAGRNVVTNQCDDMAAINVHVCWYEKQQQQIEHF